MIRLLKIFALKNDSTLEIFSLKNDSFVVRFVLASGAAQVRRMDKVAKFQRVYISRTARTHNLALLRPRSSQSAKQPLARSNHSADEASFSVLVQ